MPRFTIDWRFVDIEAELWALGQFLGVLDTQVSYLIDQDEVRTRAVLEEQGLPWDDAEVQIAFQENHARATRVFPRFMRNPFAIALCACYESAIDEIAADLCRTRKSPLHLRDVRGRNWLDGAKKYFVAVQQQPLDTDETRMALVEDLFVVRNGIAHANGELRRIPEAKLEALRPVLQRHEGDIQLEDGLIIIQTTFLEKAYSAVNGAVRELVLTVRGGPAVRPTVSGPSGAVPTTRAR